MNSMKRSSRQGKASRAHRIIACLILAMLVSVLSPALWPVSRVEAAPSDSAQVVRADGDFTCVISAEDGNVHCWGENEYGQLGDGSTADSFKPTLVDMGGDKAKALAVGHHHACAVTLSGAVKCWGYNGYGQLGDNTTTNRLKPVPVSGLGSGVAAIDAGLYHTCARTASGAMKCWGNNGNGRLGDGTTTHRRVPVDVAGMGSAVSWISAGDYHTCAVQNGGAKCWGQNNHAQLGDGTTTTRLMPVNVSGLTGGVTAIDAIYRHTCAVVQGGAKCWGDNKYGQLGDGTTTDRLTAVDVKGLTSGVNVLIVNDYHSCAVTDLGAAKCWGYNGKGALGDGTTMSRSEPTTVSGLQTGVATIDAGWYHTCAILTSGRVKCWGKNNVGQLGNDSTTDSLTPVNVKGFNGGTTPPDCAPSHLILDSNRNLIANPSAETDAGSEDGSDVVRPISYWNPTGNFTIVQYGAGEDFPGKKSLGPGLRGKNFFAGGPENAASRAIQVVDLSPIWSQVQGGGIHFNAQAYSGGSGGERDNAVISLKFLNAEENVIGSEKLGPVTPGMRQFRDGMMVQSKTGIVPMHTRSVMVEIKMKRQDGQYNHGFADKLWFSLYESAPAVKPPMPGGLGSHVRNNTVELNWDPVSCARFYQLQIRYSGGGLLVDETRYETDSFHVSLAKATYLWRVRACNQHLCRASDWAAFQIE